MLRFIICKIIAKRKHCKNKAIGYYRSTIKWLHYTKISPKITTKLRNQQTIETRHCPLSSWIYTGRFLCDSISLADVTANVLWSSSSRIQTPTSPLASLIKVHRLIAEPYTHVIRGLLWA